MAPWYDSKFNQERNSIQYPILRKVGAWKFPNSLQELTFKYQTFPTLKTKHLSKKAFILRKLFVQNSRNPVIHYEVDGRRWPLADPLILTYEAWCLTVKRQCHVHSDSHNLALNSNFKPRDGAEGGPAIRVKKESRVENYNLLWFFDIIYLHRGVRPSLPLSCVTESAIIFYYELYLKYFRNKTWQCQRRVSKGRDGGGFTSGCAAETRDGGWDQPASHAAGKYQM